MMNSARWRYLFWEISLPFLLSNNRIAIELNVIIQYFFESGFSKAQTSNQDLQLVTNYHSHFYSALWHLYLGYSHRSCIFRSYENPSARGTKSDALGNLKTDMKVAVTNKKMVINLSLQRIPMNYKQRNHDIINQTCQYSWENHLFLLQFLILFFEFCYLSFQLHSISLGQIRNVNMQNIHESWIKLIAST